mmetsp:Transcript_62553/g.176457  ORF Transcript_62553/g.176457 Transcript_62553/m.176457 type:complete len:210 (+) Transcript_62553:461-1090(+)
MAPTGPCLVGRRQTRTLRSWLQDTAREPSGAMQTPHTASSWPSSSASLLRVWMFHTLTDLSLQPTAIRWLSGRNATQWTSPSSPPCKHACSLCSCRLQTRTVPSSEPDATYCPLGAKLTELTVCRCPSNTCSAVPEMTSQTRTEWSDEALASWRPAGDHTTLCTQSVWPLRVNIRRPSSTSQMHTVLSQLPEARRAASSEKATVATERR